MPEKPTAPLAPSPVREHLPDPPVQVDPLGFGIALLGVGAFGFAGLGLAGFAVYSAVLFMGPFSLLLFPGVPIGVGLVLRSLDHRRDRRPAFTARPPA